MNGTILITGCMAIGKTTLAHTIKSTIGARAVIYDDLTSPSALSRRTVIAIKQSQERKAHTVILVSENRSDIPDDIKIDRHIHISIE